MLPQEFRRRQISRGTVLYTACRIQTNVFDFYGKRTNFSFDKAENTETVYVYVVQSDPRVVFSVADVLACHRETRWPDNAGVAFSVADIGLHQQTRDRRFSADARVIFSFVAALACHRQTRHFSADACAVFFVGGVHRFSTSSRLRCLVLSLSSQPHFVTVRCSHHQTEYCTV